MNTTRPLTAEGLLRSLERKHKSLQYEHAVLDRRRSDIELKMLAVEQAEAEVYDQITHLRFRLGMKI